MKRAAVKTGILVAFVVVSTVVHENNITASRGTQITGADSDDTLKGDVLICRLALGQRCLLLPAAPVVNGDVRAVIVVGSIVVVVVVVLCLGLLL